MKRLVISTVLGAAAAIGLSAQVSAADAQVGVPGPRNCFFSHGPVSGDPYANSAYPDTATGGRSRRRPPGRLEGAV